MEYLELPPKKLVPSPLNHRESLGDLSELVESIRSAGIIEPLIVRQVKKRHEIVCGHRRQAAAVEAGLDNVPVYVSMLRRAAELIDAAHVIYVSHTPEAWALADAQIEVRDGQIHVAA